MEVNENSSEFVDETISSSDFPIESRKRHNQSKKKYSGSNSFEKGLLDEDQWKAFDYIINGKNIHICGAAGTGKSLLLPYVVRALRNLKLKVAITAFTGTAANNLNSNSNDPDVSATTLHWWMGTGICEDSAEKEAEKLRMMKSEERWKEIDVLIIDEISMVPPELLDKIEKMARIIRKNPAPFGGIQVVFVGDWFQLEPVRDDNTSEKYKDKNYCFETDAWQRTIPDENVIVLTKNYRQQKDPEFQKLLDEIREGVLTETSVEMLKSRIDAELDLPPNIKPTFLMSHVKNVNRENQKALQEIEGESIYFTWTKTHPNMTEDAAEKLFKRIRKNLPIEEKIELKVGAPVMLLVNLCVEEGFVNGMQGFVHHLDEDDGFPYVRFANGKELKIVQYTWAQKAKRVESEKSTFVGIMIKQIPLKIAAALTIHKSQSISLDYVKLDLGPNTFAAGQAYTGLSRCRTLAGLSLTNFHINAIRVNEKVITFYKRHSALKHRIIEDGQDNDEIKKLTMQLLEKHIPSAITATSNGTRKRRGYNNKRSSKRERNRSPSPLRNDLQDDECPL